MPPKPVMRCVKMVPSGPSHDDSKNPPRGPPASTMPSKVASAMGQPRTTFATVGFDHAFQPGLGPNGLGGASPNPGPGGGRYSSHQFQSSSALARYESAWSAAFATAFSVPEGMTPWKVKLARFADSAASRIRSKIPGSVFSSWSSGIVTSAGRFQ